MPFLTDFNTNRVLKEILGTSIQDINTWKPYIKDIYFLNKLDISNLYYFHRYCENQFTDNQFTDNQLSYFNIIETVDKYVFIFEGNKPSYHKSEYCPKLHSNFTNFKIPEVIKSKGPEAVNEFRNWFKENLALFEREPSVFAMRLHLKYGIIDKSIERVDYDNSGFNYKENFTKQILQTRIDSLLRNAAKYFKIDPKREQLLKKYQRATFLAFKTDPIGYSFDYTDDEAKGVLKEYYHLFIEPVVFYLKELIAINYKQDNVEFELGESLLRSLGFEKCRHCYSDDFTEDSNIETELERLKQRFGEYHFTIEPSIFVFHNVPNSVYKIAYVYTRVFRIREEIMYTDYKKNKYFKVAIDFINSMNHYVYKEARFYTDDINEITLFKKYITRVNVNKENNKDYYQLYV